MDPRSKPIGQGQIVFWTVGLLLMVALVVFFVSRGTSQSSLRPPTTTGKIENVSLLNSLGETVGLVDELTRRFAGQKVIVSIWATWCEPCIAEIQDFERSQEHLKKTNTAIFLVNIDGGSPLVALPEVKAWMVSQNIDHETYFDFNDAMATHFKFDGIPFSIGLGTDLVQRWTHLGPIDVTSPKITISD